MEIYEFPPRTEIYYEKHLSAPAFFSMEVFLPSSVSDHQGGGLEVGWVRPVPWMALDTRGAARDARTVAGGLFGLTRLIIWPQ